MISDIPREFQRPKGFRFAFEGVNLRDKPDASPPTKYAAAKNIRGTSAQSITTRPGYTLLFATGGNPVTDLKAYARLGTDDIPRFLARDTVNSIYLDSGVVVATLAGAVSPGVAMLPFRPGGSAQSWMYVASSEDYQKLSAPDTSGAVVAQKVGIAEPQTSLEAAPLRPEFTDFSGVAADWTAGGTAGAPANEARITDTAFEVFPDPANSDRKYVLVSQNVPYQVGQVLDFGGVPATVEDVIPSIAPNLLLTIEAIRYHVGATGACTIVPSQVPFGQAPAVVTLAGLRRGALLTVNGAETALVLSVTPGPDGSISIETSTAGTYVAGNTLGGFKSIAVSGPVAAMGAITSANISSAVTAGVGTLDQLLIPGPFASALGSSTSQPQQDDYIHLSIWVDDPTKLIEAKVIFNVDATSIDYASNAYYWPLRPSDFALVAAGTETQEAAALSGADTAIIGAAATGFNFGSQMEPGANQWTEVAIPISSLIRLGGDLSRTMTNTSGVRVWVNCSANVTVKVGSIWVGGGGQPDVGADSADYRYRAVPRSSLTGAKGNATPDMRYGVRPRRQLVTVALPSAAYDSQIDTWDLYRYGGSVTSWRYLGSAPSGAATFTDDYFDDALRAGSELEVDNFEPWPSVDEAFQADPGATIAITGTFAEVSNPSGWPATVTRWLPGTLVKISDLRVYTLRARPVALGGAAYLFEFEECANFGAPATLSVQEPRVANQHLPYVWGPDASGSFFGCGDPLQPGRVRFTKPNQPDSAPDANSLELCPPSEPLIGGEIINGISLAASTARWWALQPAFQTSARYAVYERNVGRPLAAPFAHTCDGQKVYFWAKDSIAATDGGPFADLTSADLFPIFTHEGVPGKDITRHGLTFYAPDYARASSFRLAFARPYLYADYLNGAGDPCTLVLDTRTGAWQLDVYADPMRLHYAVEQQEGPLLGGFVALYPIMAMASDDGEVFVQEECADDDGASIPCLVATFEWDGDDQRSQDLWGDGYLDSEPVAPITVTPTCLEAGVATPTVVPASASREFSVVTLDGGVIRKFLGYRLEWTEWGP